MWENVGYVISSKYRTKIIKSLNESPKIPSEISKDTRIHQNHISNTLKQLKEHNLIVCINPEVRKGRVYRLTETGEKIVDKI